MIIMIMIIIIITTVNRYYRYFIILLRLLSLLLLLLYARLPQFVADLRPVRLALTDPKEQRYVIYIYIYICY